MIADIFYPIFILLITVLVCFIQKKTKLFGGFAPMLSPRHYLGPPSGSCLPSDPQLQLFLALLKTDVPIFCLYYPLVTHANYSKKGDIKI